MLSATFYGVRGSTPCSCTSTSGFGGNTSCVYIDVPGEDPIILDLGTGLRYLGLDLLARKAVADGPSSPFTATALVSHLHWDHIQGLPFFKPVLMEGSVLNVIGPSQDESSLEAAFLDCVRPPVFPVPIELLPGHINFRGVEDAVFEIGSVRITSFRVPHVGPTNGYRIDAGEGSVAYISDHQQPADGSHELPAEVVEACQGVDVLIHDAQFDADEFAQRSDWGHCTPEFALSLAEQVGARRLVLFHHDPGHDDAWVRASVERVQAAAGSSCEVIGGAEGLTVVSGA